MEIWAAKHTSFISSTEFCQGRAGFFTDISTTIRYAKCYSCRYSCDCQIVLWSSKFRLISIESSNMDTIGKKGSYLICQVLLKKEKQNEAKKRIQVCHYHPVPKVKQWSHYKRLKKILIAYVSWWTHVSSFMCLLWSIRERKWSCNTTGTACREVAEAWKPYIWIPLTVVLLNVSDAKRCLCWTLGRSLYLMTSTLLSPLAFLFPSIIGNDAMNEWIRHKFLCCCVSMRKGESGGSTYLVEW